MSRYARLWRLTWWAQHVGLPLALVVAGIILLVAVMHASNRLSAYEATFNVAFAEDDTLDAAGKQEMHAFVAGMFKLVRAGLEQAPAYLAAAAASLLLLAAYAFACGTFRLRLVSWSLAGLAVLAVVGWFGMQEALSLNRTGAMDEAALEDQSHIDVLFSSSGAVLAVSVLLLIVQGLLVLRIRRHRLAPDMPPTHRMTRSLGVNLAVPQLGLASVSAWGLAVHSAVVLGLAALLYQFPIWFAIALAFGSFGLFQLLFGVPFEFISMLAGVLRGEPFWNPLETAELADHFTESGKLLVIAALLLAARAALRFGKRLNLRRRNEIVLKDEPPVLLLRSFVDDVAAIPPNALIPRLFWRRKRLEEMIGEELTKASPFVAIGKPGETLPQIGAQRLYLADSEWQDVVQAYIARSERIIVIAGKTHWVEWELATIVAQGRAERVLIVFPRIADADRAARWQNLKPAFDGTPWSAAAEQIDVAHALAVFATRDGRFVVVKSRKAHESDYEAALRVATYLMREASPR